MPQLPADYKWPASGMIAALYPGPTIFCVGFTVEQAQRILMTGKISLCSRHVEAKDKRQMLQENILKFFYVYIQFSS
jgi:hypothetical protein